MYKHYPSLVLGFHACEREIGEALLSGDGGFKTSTNDYDWLGNGIFGKTAPIELKNMVKSLRIYVKS
ncbi:MAG: hypothetical protein ABFS56_24190 [Pseudomonadota bacterium]